MSDAVERIDIDLYGVGRLLTGTALSVPQYQRSYAWEERQIKEFLGDLERSMNADEEEYFLGSIVIAAGDGDRPEVVDGQQRLATVTILLASVRDQFLQLNDPAAEQIASQYLFSRDRRTQEISARLRLNEHDSEYFVHSVLEPNADAPVPSRLSHKRIARSTALVREHLDRILSTAADKAETLHEIVDFVEENLKLIVVSVPSHANAFLIFETLNDRGLDLATSDLLKNYLFQKAGSQLEEVKTRWVAMYELFEAAENEESVVDYIRQLWSSKHGLTREKDLYKEIKARIASRTLAVDFATELREGARLYQAIVNTDHPLWNTYGPTAQSHMRTLNGLGITRIRPLLLSVLTKFDVSEVRKALKLMVSWAVRFMVVGGLGTGTLEEYYSQRAKEIRESTIRTAVQLRNAMSSLVPNDARFKTAFAVATVSKSALARYYLRALERQIRGDSQPELIVNDNEEEVNLEHVMPEAADENWDIDEEVAQALCNRIGNLTLIREADNVDLGNGSATEKAEAFRQSSLEITKDVAMRIDAAAGGWGANQINERQEFLADHAVRAWNLRFDNRQHASES